ncbi:MAG: cytochrome C [Synechococcaceae cyanobacterium SM2_3_60]|nr:cytochrome C [Synechococcaceae cyanobacterium SM2_3_60]
MRLRRWLLPILLVFALAWLLQVQNPLQAQGTVPNLPPAERVELDEPNPFLRYQPGAQVYLAACATCHIALPPEVFPSETWRRVLVDINHYGVQIEVLQEPFLQMAWEYLRDFSRGRAENESVPYRIRESRLFRALHPGVTMPADQGVNSCLGCHPRANLGDFLNGQSSPS